MSLVANNTREWTDLTFEGLQKARQIGRHTCLFKYCKSGLNVLKIILTGEKYHLEQLEIKCFLLYMYASGCNKILPASHRALLCLPPIMRVREEWKHYGPKTWPKLKSIEANVFLFFDFIGISVP